MNWYKKAQINSLEYKVPSDPYTQTFDFYMLTLLRPSLGQNNKVSWAVEHAREKLYKTLKKELLDLLFFASVGEFSEFMDYFRNYGENLDRKKIIIQTIEPAIEQLESDDEGTDNDFRRVIMENYVLPTLSKRTKKIIRSFMNYQISRDDRENIKSQYYGVEGDWNYIAANKMISKDMTTHSEIMGIIHSVYKKAREAAGQYKDRFLYGGDNYMRIAEFWFKLNNARTLDEMEITIDGVYDLQHYSGLLMDKRRDVNSVLFKQILDFKFELRNPYELINKVSPSMKTISQYALKQQESATAEKWEKNKDSFMSKRKLDRFFVVSAPYENSKLLPGYWSAKLIIEETDRKTGATSSRVIEERFADSSEKAQKILEEMEQKANSLNEEIERIHSIK